MIFAEILLVVRFIGTHRQYDRVDAQTV